MGWANTSTWKGQRLERRYHCPKCGKARKFCNCEQFYGLDIEDLAKANFKLSFRFDKEEK